MKIQSRHTTQKTKQQLVGNIRLPFKLTHWTIFFAALALIFCVEVSALVIKHAHHSTAPKVATSQTTPTSQSPTSTSQTPKTTTPTTPTKSTSPQSSNSTKSKAASDSGSTIDQYGCATNIPSHDQCVTNAIVLRCNNQISQPALDFNSATLQARTAYNSVMNEWQIEQYKTPHSPYSEYLTDATNKFNAIYEPAYNTYFAKVQSLNSQGCSLKYPSHESPGQYY